MAKIFDSYMKRLVDVAFGGSKAEYVKIGTLPRERVTPVGSSTYRVQRQSASSLQHSVDTTTRFWECMHFNRK